MRAVQKVLGLCLYLKIICFTLKDILVNRYKYTQGFFLGVSGAEIRPHSQCNFGDFFSQFEEKNSQSKLKNFFNSSIHCEIQTFLFETGFSFDYELLFNDSK